MQSTSPSRRLALRLAHRLAAAAALCLALAAPAAAAPDGLARTPPMGWNTWNRFGCDVSEQLVRETAAALVDSGLRDAGYDTLVIDDCWQVERDAVGGIVADPVRFPSGMGALGALLHAHGLKFGIYTDAGRMTCMGRPGSFAHEAQDMATYAGWGVDFVKVDWCYTETFQPRPSYLAFRDAIERSGRPMVLSACNWGHDLVWTWGQDVAHMWRTTADISDSFGSMLGIFHANAGLYPFAGPGGWNDPDMLEVGNGGMSDTEYRAHFSLWAMQAAPLFAGNDLRHMSAATREILLNAEVIAVDQDPLGRQARPLTSAAQQSTWVKELEGGDLAVVALNEADAEATVRVPLGHPSLLPAPHYRGRDLWAHAELGPIEGELALTVPAHGVRMLRLSP